MARPSLNLHPKYKRLIHLTGETRAHIRGHLELLWEVAYESGNPDIGDATDIELACDWQGEPGKLFKALLECGGEGRAGFIEPTEDQPGRFQVHDLFDHAPDYVKRRMAREDCRKAKGVTLSELRSQAAKKRWGNLQSDASGCKWIPGASSEDANGRTPAPAPAPNEYCSEVAEPPAEPEAVLRYPTAGKVKTWDLGQRHLDAFREAYPGVDLMAELKKAKLWCENNARRRKTPGGMLRFLQSWLEKAQNSGRPGWIGQNGQASGAAALRKPEPMEYAN